MSTFQRLKDLSQYFLNHDIPEDFSEIASKELGIDISARYGPFRLKNPLLVAPGQMTVSVSQIQLIKQSGFAGCVLKSVVGEDEKGSCSMIKLRRKPTKVETVYDDYDTEGEFPIIHWDGGLDTRDLQHYLEFARIAIKLSGPDFPVIASILGHLPSYDEDFIEDEWVYTTKKLYDTGYRVFEIDFCPFLKEHDELMSQKTILRWYRVIPEMLKKSFNDIFVFPKILNLDYGTDFQLKMVESSFQGKADGVIIANRIYKKEFGCAHGGEELRQHNLKQIKMVHQLYPDFEISATGGIYRGNHIIEYLSAGAKNVQVLSFLMGKVKKPFEKKGNRFQQVFYKLMLDVESGYIACLLKQRDKT
ncbi:MAG: hypothetical protein NC906_08530 [Candidatus Omnitrophica bacterium]|nr:hypothetical protein [Candidatus Omnitrophota bacterium]MCM8817507.1 hypothetical protein [Candidatus Omnitrophota bacterium]